MFKETSANEKYSRLIPAKTLNLQASWRDFSLDTTRGVLHEHVTARMRLNATSLMTQEVLASEQSCCPTSIMASEATPRINSQYLDSFTNQTVRILGKVTSLRGETATIDANGSVTIHLNRVQYFPFASHEPLELSRCLWKKGSDD